MALDFWAIASCGVWYDEGNTYTETELDRYRVSRGFFNETVIAVPGGGAAWEICKDVVFDVVFDVVR